MPSPGFLFVDGLHADRATKKRLRQHVMKGKNAGKKVLRRSRVVAKSSALKPSEPLEMISRGSFSLVAHLRRFGGTLLSMPFPTKITPDSLHVIDTFYSCVASRVYPTYIDLSVRDARAMWLEILFYDSGTFHCSIAMMAASIEMLSKPGYAQYSQAALVHQSRAYSIVNQRLRGPDNLTDSTIWIIILLINQEQLNQRFDIAKIHTQGLERVVEMRGGLEQLDHCRPLVLKLCKTDVMVALQNGVPPMFYRDRFAQVCWKLQLEGLLLDTFTAASLLKLKGIHPVIAGLLRDIKSICILFNENKESCRMDMYDFLDMVTGFFYRLLRYRSIDCVEEEHITTDTLYHAGIIAFLMSLVLQSDGRRAVSYSASCRYFTHIFQQVDVDTVTDTDACLWSFIMGGIWLSVDEDVEWLSLKIKAVCKRQQLQNWGDVSARMSKLLWFTPLHDNFGKNLWDKHIVTSGA